MDELIVQLFSRSRLGAYSEAVCSTIRAPLTTTLTTTEIRVPDPGEAIFEIRVDFSDRPVAFLLSEFSILTEDGTAILQLRHEPEPFPKATGISVTYVPEGWIVDCVDSDPQVLFELPSIPNMGLLTLLLKIGSPRLSVEWIRKTELTTDLLKAVHNTESVATKTLDYVIRECQNVENGLLEVRNAGARLAQAWERSNESQARRLDEFAHRGAFVQGELAERLQSLGAGLERSTDTQTHRLDELAKGAAAAQLDLTERLQGLGANVERYSEAQTRQLAEIANAAAAGQAELIEHLQNLGAGLERYSEAQTRQLAEIANAAAAGQAELIEHLQNLGAGLERYSEAQTRQLAEFAAATGSGLTELANRLAGLTTQWELLHDNAADRLHTGLQDAIVRLERRLELQTRIADSAAVLDRHLLEQRLDQLDWQVADSRRREREFDALREQNEQLRQEAFEAISQNRALLASSSWRITSPLRVIINHLKRLVRSILQ